MLYLRAIRVGQASRLSRQFSPIYQALLFAPNDCLSGAGSLYPAPGGYEKLRGAETPQRLNKKSAQ